MDTVTVSGRVFVTRANNFTMNFQIRKRKVHWVVWILLAWQLIKYLWMFLIIGMWWATDDKACSILSSQIPTVFNVSVMALRMGLPV